MKKNNNYNYDTGLFFIFIALGWIIKLIFKILLFPVRVFIYNRNQLVHECRGQVHDSVMDLLLLNLE